MIRELKYYRWEFNNNKIILTNKRNGSNFVVSMAMADSFVRAYISFKTCQRNYEKDIVRKATNKRIDGYRGRIHKLQEMVGKLRGKKQLPLSGV